MSAAACGCFSGACEDSPVIPIEERFPRPSVMGVVNVTPDSFSDGGVHLDPDVTALRGDPELAGVVADAGAYLCLMHMQGEPRTMQEEPRYDDVAAEVASFLEERLAFAVAQGIPEDRVCLDPGIGFGKTVEQNLELVRRLDVLLALGRPVLVGFSRKSSLRGLTGSDDLLGASVAAAVAAFERGATILRVHDVKPHVDALVVAGAIA
jgi:dihydropteroate synthase